MLFDCFDVVVKKMNGLCIVFVCVYLKIVKEVDE